MKKEDKDIVVYFKNQLIEELKKETEYEIKARTREFEEHLREMTSAKIVSFVDSLKIYAKQDFNLIEPKITIEVHL